MKSHRSSIIVATLLIGGLLGAGSPARALPGSHTIVGLVATIPGFAVTNLVAHESSQSGSATINSTSVTITCVAVISTNLLMNHTVFMRAAGGGANWYVTLIQGNGGGPQKMAVSNVPSATTPCSATGSPVPLTAGSFAVLN